MDLQLFNVNLEQNFKYDLQRALAFVDSAGIISLGWLFAQGWK